MDNEDYRLYLAGFQNSFTDLCFDRSEFNRPDFNVDAFLAKARRRGASLEQIRDDARVYLKIIQNSMIELINQDYADFVHLSSNLAGLRGAVEKLGLEVDELTTEFEQTASKIEAAVTELTKEYEEKRRISTDQQMLERRIVALSTLENLKKFLLSPYFQSSMEKSDAIYLQKDIIQSVQRASYFIEDLQCIKNSSSTLKIPLHSTFDQSLATVLDYFQKWLETKFSSSVQNSDRLLLTYCLRGFMACDRLDAAQAMFLAQFVEPDLRSTFSTPKKQKISKLEHFKNVLEQILVLRNRYRPIFVVDSISKGHISDFSNDLEESALELAATFLDDCLLTSLLSCLQDRFSAILIPTDAATFRKAYRSLVTFSQQWSTSGTKGNRILKMVFDKFSLLIYYQLCYHDVTSSIDANLSADEPIQAPQNGQFSLKSTSLIYAQLSSVWSVEENDGLFLPPLISKYWELTLMIINRYGRHILDSVEKFLKNNEAELSEQIALANGERSTIPKRGSTPNLAGASQRPVGSETANVLILYSGDLRHLQRLICDDLCSKIFSECNIEGDHVRGHLRQCLVDTFSNLRRNSDQAVADALIPWLTSQISGQLSAVMEVPRQYRWTRKEAPTQPSPYLSTALDPVRRILLTASEKLPDDTRFITGMVERVLANVIGTYTDNLKSVFESVEKISSSLSRLKTKGASTAGGGVQNPGSVTDEQKIRMQLRLDVEEFEKLVSDFKPPVICDLSEMKSLVMSSAIAIES